MCCVHSNSRNYITIWVLFIKRVDFELLTRDQINTSYTTGKNFIRHPEPQGYTSSHEDHPQKESDIFYTGVWDLQVLVLIFLAFFWYGFKGL